MAREVKVGGTIFVVNSFSRKGATETVEQLLKRSIEKNAEREFKGQFVAKTDALYFRKTS